ncbi:MAG: hypothetical protein AAF939_01070 [Planctomycetota bacterium]
MVAVSIFPNPEIFLPDPTVVPMQFAESLLLAQDIVSLGIVGLMFILVITFAVLGSKQWHWINIVLVAFCFLAGVGSIAGMTQAFKLRRDAMLELKRNTDRAVRAEQQYEEALVGDPAALTFEAGSLRAVSGELSRELQGRGRVWPNGQVAVDGDLRVFSFAFSREEDVDEKPLADTVLFAFQEKESVGRLYPSSFIGSVRVVAESNDDVTLEPVAIADPQAYARPRGSWALFEKMPLDRRDLFKKAIVTLVGMQTEKTPENEAFAKQLEDELDGVEIEEFDIAKYRQLLMDEPFLPARRLGYDPNSLEYEELIDRYAFDGLSLGKIKNYIDANSASRKSLRFEPLPEEVFVKYRFDEGSKKTYQVDASGSLENDGLFTPLGSTVEPSLKAGTDVEFAKDDVVLVDQRSADGYQRGEQQIPPFKQGESVTEIDRIYIRQVRDYPYEFANLRIETEKLISETERLSKANAVQQKAIDDAEKQIAERNRIGSELEEDAAKLVKDLELITELANRRRAQLDENKRTVAELEKQIREAYLQIRQIAIEVSKKAFSNP